VITRIAKNLDTNPCSLSALCTRTAPPSSPRSRSMCRHKRSRTMPEQVPTNTPARTSRASGSTRLEARRAPAQGLLSPSSPASLSA
jgi:hypothetical protein